jgi:hypothetical protein
MVEQFRLEISGNNLVYQPGQVISGFVYIKLKEAIKARCVEIAALGKARTNWHVQETHPGP